MAVYTLTAKLAQNDISQTWEGHSNEEKRQVIVKIPNPDSTLSHAVKIRRLLDSYALQGDLRFRYALTAFDRTGADSGLSIIYPRLDRQIWKPLTPKRFWSLFPGILGDMFLPVMHLHLSGLVHCDLKLDNFLVAEIGGRTMIRLIDFDFLNRVGSAPGAIIFGAPELMPPEIRNNDRIYPESDIYSLGKSLEGCLREKHDSHDDYGRLREHREAFEKLLQKFTAADPFARPRDTFESLRRFNLLTADDYDSLNTVLFREKIKSVFRTTRQEKTQKSTQPSPETSVLASFDIYGLFEDIETLLLECGNRNPRRLFSYLARNVSRVHSQRYDRFWQCAVDDDMASELFQINGSYSASFKSYPERPLAADENGADRHQSIAEAFVKNEKFLPAFLLYRACARKAEAGNRKNENHVRRLNREILRLSHILLRPNAALEAAEQLQKCPGLSQGERMAIRSELLMILLYSSRFDEAADIVEKSLTEFSQNDDPEVHLELKRIKAWLDSLFGHTDTALVLLDEVEPEAERQGFAELLVRIMRTRAAVFFRIGDFGKSGEEGEKAYHFARKEKILHKDVAVLASLVMSYNEVGQYQKAMRTGKLALRQSLPSEERLILKSIYNTLYLTAIRLTRYDDARRYLTHYISGGRFFAGPTTFGVYLNNKAWLEQNEGRFDEARENLKRAIGLLSRSTPDRFFGKVFHQLGMMDFFQGRTASARRYLQKAEDIFRSLNDLVSIEESRLFVLLGDHIYQQENKVEEIKAVIDRLFDYQSNYTAIFGAIVLFLADGLSSLPDYESLLVTALERAHDKQVPLFGALHKLFAVGKRGSLQYSADLPDLKYIQKSFKNARMDFLHMLVSAQIAETYRDQNKHRPALKFFEFAGSIAEGLQNEPFRKIFKGRVLTLSRSRDDISRLIESFQGVSEALQNLDAPQDALNHIVEYAVLQTGAERGVLLVPAGGVDRLNIRANYNCDEPSLEDIRDFSTSVAESASKDETSVIIENALEDKRTKKYKSIIRHNILSVACVPVRNRGKFVGILYLDHHTIPTLFDERDLEFIRAMANFIGVIVGVIELQKDLTLTRNGVVRTASKPGEGEQFVTRNAQLMEQIAKLKAIAVSDVVVLIRGETGTGKELIARAIHENSSRSIKPMVSFNCAQITENLADSILFGVAHGAVTGVLGKEGLFAEAEGSTLFLDEIGNLDYNVQDKLLRVLEYGEYTAVGTNRPRFADVRVICATNKDLENLQNTGEFRADLYYRINTVTFTIPPLRRRGEDVDLYIDYFGKRLEEKYETRITFTDAARKALRLYSWPGNVRELKNCLESFYVQGTARQIDYGDLPSGIRDQVKEKFKKFKYDAQVLRQLLEKHKGNVSGVARELGISESTLRSILKKSEIDPNDYRR